MPRKRDPEHLRKTNIFLRLRWILLEEIEKDGKSNDVINEILENHYKDRIEKRIKDIDVK